MGEQPWNAASVDEYNSMLCIARRSTSSEYPHLEFFLILKHEYL